MADHLTDPAGFGRSFAASWGAADCDALAALMAEDGSLVTLTGLWAEGQAEIRAALTQEFQGQLAGSRLVSGKARLRALGPDAALLSQRFVLVGLTDAEGQDLGRFNAALTVVLQQGPQGWQALSATFAALSP